MTAIVYPATLPTPSEAPIQSVERRTLAPSGPFDARAFQRDRGARLDIVWPPFTDAEAAIFEEWGETTLAKWGMWFAATWPLPQGRIASVFRFLAPPSRAFIPGGYWRYSAPMELRGASEAPRVSSTFLLLHMENNLTDECGQTFRADTIITDGLANRWSYTADTPKFGDFAAHCEGAAWHANSDIYADLSLGKQSVQIEGFIRPQEAHPMIVFDIARFAQSGDPVDIQGTQFEAQLEITLLASGEFRTVLHDSGPQTVARNDIDTPVLVSMDGSAWHHWAFVWDKDAGEVRFYVNGAIANRDSVHLPNNVDRVEQRIFMGCRYSGGVPPLQLILDNGLYGDLDEIRGLKGEVTYFGDTIAVPSSPFSK